LKQLNVYFQCDFNQAIIEGDRIMCKYESTSTNGTEIGCLNEIQSSGMVTVNFTPYNKIIYLELAFDVMSLVHQLKRAAGRSDHLIIPNNLSAAEKEDLEIISTEETTNTANTTATTTTAATPTANEARIVTEASSPYSIVFVNKVQNQPSLFYFILFF
jgi:hypothetical protein